MCVGDREVASSNPEFTGILSPCLTSVAVHSQLGESLDTPLHTQGSLLTSSWIAYGLAPFPGFYPGMYLDLVRVTGKLSPVRRHKFWLGDVGEEKGRRGGFVGLGLLDSAEPSRGKFRAGETNSWP